MEGEASAPNRADDHFQLPLNLYDLPVERLGTLYREAARAQVHLDALHVLAAIEREVEDLKRVHAFAAALDGASWSDVGRRLGISKQGAQQRYGRHVLGETVEEARRSRT